MREAVIVSTARTPIGKAFRGAFNNTHGATLAGHAIEHAVKRAGLEAATVTVRQMSIVVPRLLPADLSRVQVEDAVPDCAVRAAVFAIFIVRVADGSGLQAAHYTGFAA